MLINSCEINIIEKIWVGLLFTLPAFNVSIPVMVKKKTVNIFYNSYFNIVVEALWRKLQWIIYYYWNYWKENYHLTFSKSNSIHIIILLLQRNKVRMFLWDSQTQRWIASTHHAQSDLAFRQRGIWPTGQRAGTIPY